MPTEKRHDDEIPMDVQRVRGLLRAQFPHWADLPLREWDEQGTDHTLFRLGDDMVVRMPIRPYNGADLDHQQVGREARWIPFLAPQVPFEMPRQLGLGVPDEDYPWHWSVVSWIHGDKATRDNVDLDQAALDLASFIHALHAIDPTDGPEAGRVTWGRGVSLRPGADRVRDAIERASDRYDVAPMRAAWEEAIAANEWNRPPVWFHGDLADNLIARDGRLHGVIDSAYGVGDPACDLVPGWTMFRGKQRASFFEAVGLDEATKIRARGWVLGPACFGLTYYRNVPSMLQRMYAAIECALAD